MRLISKILIDISFFPVATLVVNLVKTYFIGFRGYSVFGLSVPLEFGLEAVKQRLYLDFNWNILGNIVIPIFLICFIYQIYCVILAWKNSKNV